MKEKKSMELVPLVKDTIPMNCGVNHVIPNCWLKAGLVVVIIRNTQFEAKGFDSCYYIEWIPYDDLKDIEKIDEGGFATVDGQMVPDLLNLTKDVIITCSIKKVKKFTKCF